jgi:hypothetical protein
MISWEYKVLTLPATSSEVDEEILAIHGEKSWELVTVLLDASNHRVCYFKRPANLDYPELDPTSGRGKPAVKGR